MGNSHAGGSRHPASATSSALSPEIAARITRAPPAPAGPTTMPEVVKQQQSVPQKKLGRLVAPPEGVRLSDDLVHRVKLSPTAAQAKAMATGEVPASSSAARPAASPKVNLQAGLEKRVKVVEGAGPATSPIESIPPSVRIAPDLLERVETAPL
ncbi:Uncharacterized protein PBTT_03675 [Plasmodiophora brassicae]|uniref:Uncharacterized protein n=1 Tax=Plasmodiophora brassicae TaxID=37360 RepID=A0A0G4IS19_PLABS|nr:hypothetical protein PBRA_006159 [Plasmodiophora brassicae]